MKSIEEIQNRIHDIKESIHHIDMDIECGEVDLQVCSEYEDELQTWLSALNWVIEDDKDAL